MSENWRQSEIRIVINDKSQDSTAKHLSYDGLLRYKFIIHRAGERNYCLQCFDAVGWAAGRASGL